MAKSSDRRLSSYQENIWDGNYFYKIPVEEGEGFEMPLLESSCTFIFGRQNTASLTDGFTEEDVANIGIPITCINKEMQTTIGSPETPIMVAIEKCLMTMKKGEVSCFALCLPDLLKTVNDVHGYDEARDSCLIFFTLILIEFSVSRHSCDLTADEKYNLALFHKEKGKELFHIDPELAFYRFSTAAKYLITIPTYSEVVFSRSGISQSDKEQYDSLRCTCFLNLAACQLIFDNHEAVIKNCSWALSIQPNSQKGLYRRGKSYLALGLHEEARKDLLKLSKLSPKNKEAIKLLRQIDKE